MAKKADDDRCPCGSGLAYSRCCATWHRGAPAPTAEALMRSRYSAYVLGLDDYLLATWHTATRPAALDADPVRWLGVDVKRHAPDGEDRATVEFVARFRADGRGHRLHETSRFVREEGHWYYVDGDIAEA